jgi:hypothetical protein
MTKPDPTKDPEFQKVVQTFLHTKPQRRVEKDAANRPSKRNGAKAKPKHR